MMEPVWKMLDSQAIKAERVVAGPATADVHPKPLRLQPTKVKTTSIDSFGMLVFEGDLLVAVLVRLEPSVHGEHYAGKWNLEATFDSLPYPPDKVFNSLDHAQRWLSTQLQLAESRLVS